MQSTHFKARAREIVSQLANLSKNQPKVMGAFHQLTQNATKEGALDKKTKEMIALGIAIATRCDDCIAIHVQSLVKLGLTQSELEEVVTTALYMGGGPALMYGTHALEAFKQFSED